MEERNPFDQLVCHHVDKVEFVKDQDAYDFRCTCGKWYRIEGLTLAIITKKERDAKRRPRPSR